MMLWSSRVPETVPLADARYYRVIRIAILLALQSHLLWVGLFFFLGVPELALFNVFSVLIFSLNLFLNRRGRFLLAINIGALEVTAHQLLASHLLGSQTKFSLLLVIGTMLVFLVPRSTWLNRLGLLGMNVSAFLVIEGVLASRVPTYVLADSWIGFFAISNTLICFVFLGVLGVYFTRAVDEMERGLIEERRRSDTLLLNILPASIAERLKRGEPTIADEHAFVSVLFADLAGFTTHAETLSPAALVDELNLLFSGLDELSERYGLQKIKTIGDAYMVAGGLDGAHSDHVVAMARFALAVRESVEPLGTGTAPRFRIGIHCGPVVAGVIGKRKFAYDLWGDTANVASRMESHGEPGKIHVSAAFAEALGSEFALEARPPVTVKGKGEMQTYFLLGERD